MGVWGTGRVLAAGAVCLVLAGCGTPPEVKTLSAMQVANFKTLVQVQAAQASALMALAGKVQAQAANDLDQLQAQAETLVKQELTGGTVPTPTLVDGALSAVRTQAQITAQSKAKLAADIAAIQAKLDQISAFVTEMGAAQQVLDTYLNQAQAGQELVQSVTSAPFVQAAVSRVSDLAPQVAKAAADLERLMQEFGGASAGTAPTTN